MEPRTAIDLCMRSVSIDEINQALSCAENKECVAVWRSTGSNIFFEFGVPTIKRIKPKTREPFTVVRGQIAIGIHADDWFLRVKSNEILNSETVNDDNIAKIGSEYFVGKTMPKFSFSPEGVLQLVFEKEISLRVEKNDYSDVADGVEDEVTIYLPGGDGFEFNYERGFYKAAESEESGA